MKKIASILLIIVGSLNLLVSLTNVPTYFDEFLYIGFEDIGYWFSDLIYNPISSLAFMLLGIALINDGNSSSISHQGVPAPAISKSKTTENQNDIDPNDVPSTGLNIVCFLIPVVGLIIYLTQKDKSPKKASSAGKAAIWGVGVSVALSIISIVASIAIASSMY